MYSTTKFGMRGFMEALAIQLHVDGHSAYVKTTTVFPHFVNTRPLIKNMVDKGCNLKVMLPTEQCGRAAVNGLLEERDIITVPRYLVSPLYYM